MFLLILSRLRCVVWMCNNFWHKWSRRIYYVFKLIYYVFLLLWSSKQSLLRTLHFTCWLTLYKLYPGRFKTPQNRHFVLLFFFTLATPGNVLYRVIRALSKWREYLRDGSRLSIFLITEWNNVIEQPAWRIQDVSQLLIFRFINYGIHHAILCWAGRCQRFDSPMRRCRGGGWRRPDPVSRGCRAKR